MVESLLQNPAASPKNRSPNHQLLSPFSDQNDSSFTSIAELFAETEPEQVTSFTQPSQSLPDLSASNIIEKEINFDYIESAQNIQGNYNTYVYRALLSMSQIKQYSESQSLTDKPHVVIAETRKKTLILDLDETLIHADFDENFSFHDKIITFQADGYEVSVPIFLRPGVVNFLKAAKENFEICVFTASKQEYADAVLNYLDPENNIFRHRLYRQHCICIKNKVFVKDLRILVNRKLEDIIMVDNSLYSFTNQISNGVLINSFYNDRNDNELLNLLNYLQLYLLSASDVRIVNEKFFNFKMILEEFYSKM